jgi:hypothetical protein
MDFTSIILWLRVFFDELFLDIFAATIILFLAVLVTWGVYRTLSRCNIFQLKRTWDLQRVTVSDHVWYVAKYFFLFPIITFAGFLIVAFSLIVLTRQAEPSAQATSLFIAIVLVSTIRVAAHVNESMAEDLAKLAPLSMLSALFFQSADFTSVTITIQQVAGFIQLIPGFSKYLLFTILLELVLRAGGFLWRTIRNRDAEQV